MSNELPTPANLLAKIYKGLCCLADTITSNTPTETADTASVTISLETGAGSTPADVYEISIANVGAANGSVNGVTVEPNVVITFQAVFDPHLHALQKVPSVSYDATGTQFLITQTS